MAPRVDTIPDTDTLPESADTVIIGGGIVGISAALFLAERGQSVVVLEKGKIAGEQSGRNWGWCREQLRSMAEVPIAMLSMRLWRGLSERMGIDSGFRQTGMMVVSKDDAEIARWEKWLEDTRSFGMEGALLSSKELGGMINGSATQWKAGIYSPVDGWAEPAVAAPAIALAARAKGARVIQNCAARGWETEGGRISHVVTEKGTVRTSRVLVAGGAWSAMLLRRHGHRFIQSGVYGTAFRTEPGPEIYGGGIGSELFSFRRRDDGGYTVGLRGRGRVELTPMGLRETKSFLPLFFRRKSDLTIGVGKSFFRGPFAWRNWSLSDRSPFEEERVYDPAADGRLVEDGIKAFREAYPVLGNIKVAESWGGLIDSTPDMVPCICPVGGQDGLFLASGFSGHGMALGPGAGWLAAQMVSGETPDVDPAPFRMTRFSEGSGNAPHHWV